MKSILDKIIISCKVVLIVAVFGSGFTAKSQLYKQLDKQDNGCIIPKGYSVIYGNFIQRLGFSSGGFPQDIRLLNMDTKEIYAFRVKATFKSTKENKFCYIIKPGNYVLLNYWWTKSKWYGGDIYTEPIYKSSNPALAEQNSQISNQFKFTILENTLNYTGTWHFETESISFTNDKAKLDSSMITKYKFLNFFKANIVLPN